MLTPLERSPSKRLNKRGITNRALADLVGHDRDTGARVLGTPTDGVASSRTRRSRVDALSEDSERWFCAGLPVQRMLDWHTQQADVPIRCEGLPGDYLPVAWGAGRSLPFDTQPPATRCFYAARLKYRRFLPVLWQDNMTPATLLRWLCATCTLLGGVPWVCVFDNPKTVTPGRESAHQPIWHPRFFQLAPEFGLTPHACEVGAANQTGSVENLVKCVKSNFRPARSFFDDADLKDQAERWLGQVKTTVGQATAQRPRDLLVLEQAALSGLPEPAADDGLALRVRADRESRVPVEGARYSVPVGYASRPVPVRLHATRVRISPSFWPITPGGWGRPVGASPRLTANPYLRESHARAWLCLEMRSWHWVNRSPPTSGNWSEGVLPGRPRSAAPAMPLPSIIRHRN